LNNRTALILAAGIGGRLLPKTKELPKCLLMVCGKPILQHQLEALLVNGIRDVVIVLGHFGGKIQEFISDSGLSNKIKITYVNNDDYLISNSSYSLWLARDYIKNGYIHLNSDLLFSPELIKKLLGSSYENSVIVDSTRHDQDMARAVFEGNQIVAMGRYPEITSYNAVVVGPFAFSFCAIRKILTVLGERFATGNKDGWCYLDFANIMNDSKYNLHYVDAQGNSWQEIDTHEDYMLACDIKGLSND